MSTTMQAVRLAPAEPLPGVPSATVGDFWAWAYSDVLTNGTRAMYAEFLVASALGLTGDIRREWGSFDLLYRDRPVEVKAAGYVQSWGPPQATPTIRFDIRKRYPWYPEPNTMGPDRIRPADCYVFSLFRETDRARAFTTVLDTSLWRFYVVGKAEIEARVPDQETISLTALQSTFGVSDITFDELRSAVDTALFPPRPAGRGG